MKLKLYYIETPNGKEEIDEFNLSNPEDINTIIMSFGNGCYEEAKVEVENLDTLNLFISIINKGGYFMASDSENYKSKRLYEEGFACFPDSSPFIFINPKTKDGSKHKVNDILSKNDWIESFKPERRWWQLWK